MRIATSIVTWRLPIIVGTAALAIGCRQEAPLAPAMAAKVADIAEVNTDSGFVDSIALARDASRVATGERNGSIRLWALTAAAERARLARPPRQGGPALAPTGDRYSMRLFDLARKTSWIVASGSKAYHAVDRRRGPRGLGVAVAPREVSG